MGDIQPVRLDPAIEHTGEVIGSCAFKAPPSEDGTVEIAYFTYPTFERRGYATAMARELIELASGSADVRRIVAAEA